MVITIDDYGVLENIRINGRSSELAKLLNIKSPESLPYQSQITVDMLNTAPIPKQWINEDSMSLISQTMGVVEPDGHSYYYYEYKIQNESFLMVKKS